MLWPNIKMCILKLHYQYICKKGKLYTVYTCNGRAAQAVTEGTKYVFKLVECITSLLGQYNAYILINVSICCKIIVRKTGIV